MTVLISVVLLISIPDFCMGMEWWCKIKGSIILDDGMNYNLSNIYKKVLVLIYPTQKSSVVECWRTTYWLF